MHIKKCFGEMLEQPGGEFKVSIEKDNKNTKKLRSIMLAVSVFLLCTITGCDSPDYTASIKEPFSHTETMAPTDTSDDIVSTGEALSEEDVLVDVSSLSIPEYSGTDFYVVNDNVPFFNEKIKAYPGDSFIYLSELDELGRCGTCAGLFSYMTLPEEERGEIGHIKPSGWHTAKYDKSVIPDMYLYNRCHLLMYAVSGINDDTRNLITGTRQLNLDMLELENQVLDTLKYDESVKLLYRVTPIFDGDNLVAKGVLMEAASLGDGDGLSFCMFIYNVQDGIVIDYATGDSRLADDSQTTQEITQQSTTEETMQSGGGYVANMNTKKFHYPSCSSVRQINAENRWDYTGTREELISMGYEPCRKCNP
jgi:DNA-entry nuclease